MTSRELVWKTLEFENKADRAPRQLWVLPWATLNYPKEFQNIAQDFPSDFAGPDIHFEKSPPTVGNPYAIGQSQDEWGCVFENLQEGVVGEVKNPIISTDDENWDDLSRVHVPEEWFTFDIDEVNAFCAGTDKFVMAGCNPRPFERLQFLRGTVPLYMDLVTRPANMMAFIDKLHTFYCELLEKWAKTDVDGLGFMDDWGSQNNLLINPEIWCEIFKPMYKDYIDIAHRHGKKAFMHSDGNTLAIYPHLTELGLDAFNSQIFCIGVENLTDFKGKITFWGEIDRQFLLPRGTVSEISDAVRKVYELLWKDGGCIAQCEFGPGAKPENVRKVFETWDACTKK